LNTEKIVKALGLDDDVTPAKLRKNLTFLDGISSDHDDTRKWIRYTCITTGALALLIVLAYGLQVIVHQPIGTPPPISIPQ
jgi:hypothetical protein